MELDRGVWARLVERGLTRLGGRRGRRRQRRHLGRGRRPAGSAAGAAAPGAGRRDEVVGRRAARGGRSAKRRWPAGRLASRPDGDAVNVREVARGRRARRRALGGPSRPWRVAGAPADRLRRERPAQRGAQAARQGGGRARRPRGGPVVDSRERRAVPPPRGPSARSAQMAGAMGRLIEVGVELHREREAVRPSDRALPGHPAPGGRHRSIEAALARAATDTAVARAAASDWKDPGMLFAVAVAKSCAGHAASVVVRNAHQVLGAIGTTLEHELHTLTKPILLRRSEYGSAPATGTRPSRRSPSSAGRDRLWTLITTGRAKPRSVRRLDGG